MKWSQHNLMICTHRCQSLVKVVVSVVEMVKEGGERVMVVTR